MVLSRIWILLVVIAAGAAIITAMLIRQTFGREQDAELTEQLNRDRREIELWLRIDARSRMDAITPIAADQEVRTALRESSNRRDRTVVQEPLQSGLTRRLRTLNRQLEGMQGDLVFAVDNHGEIIAQLGDRPPPAGAGLGNFPLVRHALSGYARDDVWVYNDVIYRMAARPVIDAGQYVGAVVHGKAIDDTLAAKLSERIPGASLAFFRGPVIKAAHMSVAANGAADTDDFATALEGSADEPSVLTDEQLQDGQPTAPRPVGSANSDAPARAIYSLVTGSAAHANVGYAIARPVETLGTTWEVIGNAPEDDWDAIAAWIPATVALALFAVAMLFIFLERDRPLRQFAAATRQLAEGGVDRLAPANFGGRYRQIAEQVNLGLDRAANRGSLTPRARPEDLGSILPTDGKDQSYFGFAGEPEPTPIPNVPAAPPAAPKAPPPPPPSAATGRPTPTSALAPPAHAMPVASPANGAPLPGSTPLSAEAEEGRTMIAEVPEELLHAVSQERILDEAGDQEELHFRDVYDQFVASKKNCGESTVGLTYDRFRQTLMKNRDQIKSQHGAPRVRFSVYVKDGRTALKATPTRDTNY